MSKFILASLLVCALALSQLANANHVYVSHTGEDDLGRQLAYRLKEEVRKSATMQLVDTATEATYTIDLITEPHDRGPKQYATIYAVTIATLEPRTHVWAYLQTRVGLAGGGKIESTASELIVWVANNVEKGAQIAWQWVSEGCPK